MKIDNIYEFKNNNNEKKYQRSNFSNLPRIKTNGKSGALDQKVVSEKCDNSLLLYNI